MQAVTDSIGDPGNVRMLLVVDAGQLDPHDDAEALTELRRAELERRLGHANDRYLRLYANPPDDIAAGYIEDLVTRR
ncbi:hypothetical protein [Nonomuraea sp. NPDC003804]|uniref:hypothetical protein n=1 Tax=Nonomuraea sp. NPDC003804 TaxID=3154547 RepID=UPI0033BB788A